LKQLRRSGSLDVILGMALGQPDVMTRYTLARALLCKGDVREAENTCREALRLAPHLKPLIELLKEILQRGSKP
jgi:uncharacterized protein HemY